MKVDLSKFTSEYSLRDRLSRALWNLTWLLLFRPSLRPLFAWRRMLLRVFGARIGKGVRVYPSARIFLPANLEMNDFSVLGPDVDCYCVDKIRINSHAMVSQHSILCTASHDIEDPHLRLITAPVTVGESAWVCAAAFIGPGVTIHEGAVVGARAAVFKDVPAWTVVGGNPARLLKQRELLSDCDPV